MGKRLTVIGTGYLGATHAAAMAELGFDVLGVDVDPKKIDSLSRGELPFHEPGLPELLRKHIASGRLRLPRPLRKPEHSGTSTSLQSERLNAPGEDAADMTYVDASISSLAGAVTRDALIVGKSTVPVGSARRLKSVIAEAKGKGIEIDFAWNPEFLREGFAV